MPKQFIRFLFAGGLNTLITYALYIIILNFTSYILAYSLAYGFGIVLSYYFNVYFVFRQKASLISFAKFPLVYLTQYLCCSFILWVLVDIYEFPDWAALIPAIILTIPLTFTLSKFIITHKNKNKINLSD